MNIPHLTCIKEAIRSLHTFRSNNPTYDIAVCVYCYDQTVFNTLKEVADDKLGTAIQDEGSTSQSNVVSNIGHTPIPKGNLVITDMGSSKKFGSQRQTELDLTKSQREQNCCICMDVLTNPKKLSCGHVFCTECIEQQFKFKGTCY